MRLGYIDTLPLQPNELFIIAESGSFSFEPLDKTEGLKVFHPNNDEDIHELVRFYSKFFKDLFNPDHSEKFHSKCITFFGGSFNPWHDGHLACTNLMEKYMGVDHELIIVPDISPWKNNQSISLLKRWNLFQNVLSKSEHLVYPDFLFQDQKNPTFHWISRLKKNREDLEVNLLIGFDSFCSLEKWYEARQLIKLLNGLYIASRNDIRTLRELKQAKYKDINPNLSIKFLGHHRHENVSSTQLRQHKHK